MDQTDRYPRCRAASPLEREREPTRRVHQTSLPARRILIRDHLEPVFPTSLPEDNRICKICMEDYAHRTGKYAMSGTIECPVRLPCGHIVGEICVIQWFMCGKTTCPFCRQVLSTKCWSEFEDPADGIRARTEEYEESVWEEDWESDEEKLGGDEYVTACQHGDEQKMGEEGKGTKHDRENDVEMKSANEDEDSESDDEYEDRVCPCQFCYSHRRDQAERLAVNGATSSAQEIAASDPDTLDFHEKLDQIGLDPSVPLPSTQREFLETCIHQIFKGYSNAGRADRVHIFGVPDEADRNAVAGPMLTPSQVDFLHNLRGESLERFMAFVTREYVRRDVLINGSHVPDDVVNELNNRSAHAEARSLNSDQAQEISHLVSRNAELVRLEAYVEAYEGLEFEPDDSALQDGGLEPDEEISVETETGWKVKSKTRRFVQEDKPEVMVQDGNMFTTICIKKCGSEPQSDTQMALQ